MDKMPGGEATGKLPDAIRLDGWKSDTESPIPSVKLLGLIRETCISSCLCWSIRRDDILDLTYHVNLRHPCQPGHARRVRHDRRQPDTPTLPNIGFIIQTLLSDVSVIRDSYILNRFSNVDHLFEEVQNQTWLPKMYDEMPEPEGLCEQTPDLMSLVWQRTLYYTILMNYIKKDELIWAGFTRGIRQRAVTYEVVITELEMSRMADLLCAVKLFSEAQNIELADAILEEYTRKQNQRVKIKTMMKGDTLGFQILHTFTDDFLPFISHYFENCH